MNILTKITPHILSLMALSSLLVSCYKEPKTEEVKVESVQINSFKLFSLDLPELGDFFFSIDHNKSEIFNARLLPYQSTFKMAKMQIATDAKNNIKVFVDGQERAYTAQDSIDLSGWEKGIQIEVSNSSMQTVKRYQLSVRRYASDPMAFNWKKISSPTLPTAYTTRRAITGKRHIYLVYDEKQIFAANKEQPEQWYALCSFADPSQLPLQVIEGEGSEEGSFYAVSLPAAGSIAVIKIERLGAAASSVYTAPIESEILDCLGAFTEPGDKGLYVAAIAAKEQKKFFVALAIQIDASTLKVNENVGVEAPAALAEAKNLSALLQSREAYHDKIECLAAAPAHAGRTQIWSTTSGKDWLTLAPSTDEFALPFASNTPIVLTYDPAIERYILIHVRGTQKCYYTTDGINWRKANDEILLPNEPQFKSSNADFIGFGISDHRILLIPGASSDLWIGIPAMYEEK